MIKSVKWFFVVLIFSFFISFSFEEERVSAETLTVGEKAPELVLCNQTQSLDLRAGDGKYTLLSFWASYDATSRVKNAALSKEVRDYDRIKMISVSFDHYASVYRQAVKQDGIQLPESYVETEGANSKAFQAYGLENGFGNYLLDSNGVIIAKNLDADELSSYLN